MKEPPLSHNVYFDIMSVFCSEKIKSALLSASNWILSGLTVTLYNMVKKNMKSHTVLGIIAADSSCIVPPAPSKKE